MDVKQLALNISVDATGKLFPTCVDIIIPFDDIDAKIRVYAS